MHHRHTSMRPLATRLAAAAAVAVLVVLAWIPAGVRADEPPRLEPVVVETDEGRFTFTTEIADTPQLRSRGLMFRHQLPPDRAMLFDWGRVAPVSMWMRNTYVSLDMIFIDAAGVVTKIAEATEPLSETTISSEGPVAAVLEVVAGTADRIGLEPGDRVHHAMFANADD